MSLTAEELACLELFRSWRVYVTGRRIATLLSELTDPQDRAAFQRALKGERPLSERIAALVERHGLTMTRRGTLGRAAVLP